MAKRVERLKADFVRKCGPGMYWPLVESHAGVERSQQVVGIQVRCNRIRC
jgi:hypothetical protein